ncbi:MAG: FmdB family zinc ribbon protein [Smithellaceae bacterium]
MPIYEYKCRKCGKQFEAFQGITDPELKSCKFCKGRVNKLVSMSSFTLKGSGWYATDYGGKTSPVTSAPAKEAAATVEKSATATESATATTTSGKEN